MLSDARNSVCLFVAGLSLVLTFLFVSSCPPIDGPQSEPNRPAAAAIGERIFFDISLSEPAGQGCVSCHQPDHAFADPRRVSPGTVSGRRGTRNAPTLMYAALIPPFAYEDMLINGEEVYFWEGGQFLDGRAEDLFAQVSQPFFEHNEMNLTGEAALAKKLRQTPYAADFRRWVGDVVWHDDQRLTYHAYRSLVEFLKEPEFRPFDARIDDYLNGNPNALTELEQTGLKVFRGAGGCADCHLLEPNSWEQPLLSDYGYDNLGVPSIGEKDPGLSGHTGNPDEIGQFKAPTLRNITLTAPYMHNGSIRTLREVMEFYNKRDLEPERWAATDYPQTVNHDDMGNLGLTDADIDALLALMHAFTDQTLLEKKKGSRLPAAPAGVPTTSERALYFPDWTHRLSPSFPDRHK